MMSDRFRKFFLLFWVLGFFGSAILLSVRDNGPEGSSIDDRIEKMVSDLKVSLPTPYDDHLTLIDVEKMERDIVYLFEVDIAEEKLLEMEDYFQRQNQFDVCSMKRQSREEYELGGIAVVGHYRSTGTEHVNIKTRSTVSQCKFNLETLKIASPNIIESMENDLREEYWSFFSSALE